MEYDRKKCFTLSATYNGKNRLLSGCRSRHSRTVLLLSSCGDWSHRIGRNASLYLPPIMVIIDYRRGCRSRHSRTVLLLSSCGDWSHRIGRNASLYLPPIMVIIDYRRGCRSRHSRTVLLQSSCGDWWSTIGRNASLYLPPIMVRIDYRQGVSLGIVGRCYYSHLVAIDGVRSEEMLHFICHL